MTSGDVEMEQEKTEAPVKKKSKPKYELPWIEKHRPRLVHPGSQFIIKMQDRHNSF